MDEEVRKIGAIMEQLGARFELVLEAVTGFGGRLEALREEMVGQFTEVGRQIRFLSDRIAENREAIAAVRADLGAEMVRIGEHLGGTRVHFREEFATVRGEFHDEFNKVREESRLEFSKVREEFHRDLKDDRDELRASMGVIRDEFQQGLAGEREELRKGLAGIGDELHDEIAAEGERSREAAAGQLTATTTEMRGQFVAMRGDLERGLPEAAAGINSEITTSASAIIKKFDADLKQTNKAVTSLARKFERFDDRITVQAKDQDQRIRKLERRA